MKKIMNLLLSVLIIIGLTACNSAIDNSTNTKNIIIMDEIDGMAGNEDKGGIKALIDIAKKTKVPIIFICNEFILCSFHRY